MDSTWSVLIEKEMIKANNQDIRIQPLFIFLLKKYFNAQINANRYQFNELIVDQMNCPTIAIKWIVSTSVEIVRIVILIKLLIYIVVIQCWYFPDYNPRVSGPTITNALGDRIEVSLSRRLSDELSSMQQMNNGSCGPNYDLTSRQPIRKRISKSIERSKKNTLKRLGIGQNHCKKGFHII